MIECGSLELAHARVHARHGQRAQEADWQRLEVAREFAALLEAARSTPLQPWLEELTPHSTPHQIDDTMRQRWHATVSEVGAWMPTPWQAALAWCGTWADLPGLQHLARGGDARAWMHGYPDWRALASAEPAQQAQVLATGPWAPLAEAWATPDRLGAAWLSEWQRRLPRAARVEGQPPRITDEGLQQLMALLLSHAQAFASAPPGPGTLLRRTLQSRLGLLLRRVGLGPAVAFIHLALCALDLERLRGELQARALFALATRGA